MTPPAGRSSSKTRPNSTAFGKLIDTGGDRNETLVCHHHGVAGCRVDRFRLRTNVRSRHRDDHAYRRRGGIEQLEPRRRRQLASGGWRHCGRQRQGRLSCLEEFVQGLSDPGRVLGGSHHQQRHFHPPFRSRQDHRRQFLRGEHLRPAPRPVLRYRGHRQFRQGICPCSRLAASGTPSRSRPGARS